MRALNLAEKKTLIAALKLYQREGMYDSTNRPDSILEHTQDEDGDNCTRGDEYIDNLVAALRSDRLGVAASEHELNFYASEEERKQRDPELFAWAVHHSFDDGADGSTFVMIQPNKPTVAEIAAICDYDPDEEDESISISEPATLPTLTQPSCQVERTFWIAQYAWPKGDDLIEVIWGTARPTEEELSRLFERNPSDPDEQIWLHGPYTTSTSRRCGTLRGSIVDWRVGEGEEVPAQHAHAYAVEVSLLPAFDNLVLEVRPPQGVDAPSLSVQLEVQEGRPVLLLDHTAPNEENYLKIVPRTDGMNVELIAERSVRYLPGVVSYQD